jgi:hypothetical protein
LLKEIETRRDREQATSNNLYTPSGNLDYVKGYNSNRGFTTTTERISEITSSRDISADEVYGNEEPDPMKLRVPVSHIIMSFNKPLRHRDRLLTIIEDQDSIDLN